MQDNEVFDFVNKFVQKELVLNSIKNSLEDTQPGILQSFMRDGFENLF